jgi:hypothetical protein
MRGGFSGIDFEVICAHNRVVGDDIFFNPKELGYPPNWFKKATWKASPLAS